MECKILKKRQCEINQYYSNNHQAIDVVGKNYTLDYIIAHSAGKITEIQDGLGNMKGSIGNISYGNYIKIEHQNGYQTLYAHLENGINFKKNQYVEEGQTIGNMGDSGNAYGKHLHFEAWKNNKRINPLEYINKSFINAEDPINTTIKYKIGDTVEINGVYISSSSKEKLRPLITRGKITKIITDAKNPYLLEDGKIGWVNDNVIISKADNNRYLSNKTYKGTSIVDALNEINIDSSYQYRSELAKLNNINDYTGTSKQNEMLLNLLKQGKLQY